jgi:hypothetical protein
LTYTHSEEQEPRSKSRTTCTCRTKNLRSEGEGQDETVVTRENHVGGEEKRLIVAQYAPHAIADCPTTVASHIRVARVVSIRRVGLLFYFQAVREEERSERTRILVGSGITEEQIFGWVVFPPG